VSSLASRAGLADEPLVPVAQPGPWSAVDAIVGFGPRIWFTNAELFRNQNAADIYSYDPATGSLRYERALFSQGAGRPLVAGGLLYWPFEDPRFSAGLPEFAVTNGTDWAWYVLPEGEAFHLHAMAALDGKLYAASSAYKADLHVSADNGATWQALYAHPTPKGRISRISSFANLKGRLYAGLAQRRDLGPRILMVTAEGVVPAPGWPDAQVASGLTVYRGALFAILQDETGRRLWHSDGGPATPVANGPTGRPLRALAAGEDALWAITASDGKGALWRSTDGQRWTKSQDFRNATPVSLAVYENAPYVGSIGPEKRGTLWGPRPPARVRTHGFADSARSLPPAARRSENTEHHLANLGDLAAPVSLSDREWLDQKLMPHILALARANEPALGSAIAAQLAAPVPERLLTFYGGQVKVTTATLAQWYLLWALAQQDGGRVPPALLAVPWDLPANRPEKYFHPTPAAAWAMAQLDQRDTKSLAALVDRLDGPGDPKWLAGDIVGALTALTGQRFGHDYDAWRSWWVEQQEDAALHGE
jgi:outer membrane protein assembly factor BamB